MNQANSTTVVRTAVNIFIFIAIGISLFQEISFVEKQEAAQEEVAPKPEVNVNGTQVEGLYILSTDKFKGQFKDLLIEKDYNIEIKDYPFEDTEYWINLFLTHGHMVVVFFLVSRHQAEQDQSKKMKIMMLGMALVFGWMFLSPQLKTQRLGLEYKGVRVYQKDDFDKDEILAKITTYEEDSVFGLDPIPQPAPSSADTYVEEAIP